MHLLVTAEHRQLCSRRHLVAYAYADAANDTRHRSGDGAEAEVNLGSVDRRTCLADSGLRLFVVVLGVVEHVTADDVLGKQVLVRLPFHFRAALVGLRRQQVRFGGFQFQFGITRIDDEQGRAFLHLLTFGHAYLHQLSADLRHDVHVVLTFHFGAKPHRQHDIGFLYCQRLVRRLGGLGHVDAARYHSGCYGK